MHSSTELRSDSFDITIAGEPGSVEQLFDGFTDDDRIGVTVRDDYGAVGASTIILAAVTAFYDRQRATSSDFFIYPDYYLFHIGRPRGDHNMLDIYREHKEVVVPDDPEEILRAINDRGITRLIVEDGAPGEPDFRPDTRASASRRIATALAYSPTGRVESADVIIAGNATTESYVSLVLDPIRLVNELRDVGDADIETLRKRIGEVAPENAAAVRDARAALLEDGRPVETFRRISVQHALALLDPQPG